MRETHNRIRSFNNFVSEHLVRTYANVFWIELYWQFIDEMGCLIPRLYGRRFLHLSVEGKNLMSNCINDFQSDRSGNL